MKSAFRAGRVSLCRPALTSPGPNPSNLTLTRSYVAEAKQKADRRDKEVLKDQLERKKTKKLTKLRLEAKHLTESPVCLDLLTALRILRAAEVGNSASATTITLNIRIIGETNAALISGSFRLPKPLNQEDKVCVFTSVPEKADEARRAGASLVGGEDLIQNLADGKTRVDFNMSFATPEMSSKLKPVARLLGSKGLLPNIKRGTITDDIEAAISKTAGSSSFKQKGVVLSIPVARVSFTDSEIVRNIMVALDSIRSAIKAAPSRKPVTVGKVVVSSTKGPGIVIDT